MTVSTTNSRQQYSGNGSSTSFSFSFKVLTAAEVTVLGTNTRGIAVDGIGAGETITYTEGSDYSVSLSDPGGTVTFNSAPSAGIRVTIIRNSKQTQDIDYVENDPFPANTHEEGLDRAVLRDQERADEISRALRIGPGDDSSIDLTLPTKVQRAGTGLGFDANGEPTAFSGFVDSKEVPVTSFMETLLDDTTASEARQTLGVAGQADRFTVTSGTGTSYTANPNTPTSLADGETVFLRFHTSSDADPTLNVNSTGAKVLLDNQRRALNSGDIAGNDLAVVMYDSALDSGNGAWVALGFNPTVFNANDASFYTDIPARLGYTPANVAGDNFTGVVRLNHQIPLQSRDSNGNIRQLAAINANDVINLGDINSPRTNINAVNNNSVTIRNNTVWHNGNMPEFTGAVSAANTDDFNLGTKYYQVRFFYKRRDNGNTGVVSLYADGQKDTARNIISGNNNGDGRVSCLGLSDGNNNVTLDVNPGGGNPQTLRIDNDTGSTIDYSLLVWKIPLT